MYNHLYALFNCQDGWMECFGQCLDKGVSHYPCIRNMCNLVGKAQHLVRADVFENCTFYSQNSVISKYRAHDKIFEASPATIHREAVIRNIRKHVIK